MVIKIPYQHYFPDFLRREVLEKTGYSLPDWEISVQRKDDLAWSIVLSFLISTNHRDPKDFSRRLIALTHSKNNLFLVRNAIKTFNPFRNRYSCFYDESLQQVVGEFKETIGWDNLRRVSDKLSVVSERLGCPILHIWKDKYAFRYQIYSASWKSSSIIVIISYDLPTGSVCNFLLDHDQGIRLKFTSLRYFLKEVEIPRKILKKVEVAVGKEEHFLISLLYNNFQGVISKLYRSAYLVSKLAEAGFETDPKSKVGGFSAFYHALALGEIEVLYKMYYFSANNFQQTQESHETPESCTVNNLQELKETFLNDLVKFDTLGQHPNYNRIKKNYNNLIRFNEFLLEINSNLLKIKDESSDLDSTDDIVFEASKRRDIILNILDTYKIFFLSDTQEKSTQSSLDDFIEFRKYYNSIDLATAITFFSNIIYLKERLALENENTCSKMEISFYQTIYYNCFSNTTRCEEYLKEKMNNHNIFFIPLIKRSENMKNIEKFSTNLREIAITPQNVIRHVPEEEILNIFKSLPIFKNVIHLNRIKNYIETGLGIKIVDERSVLVIQRVLQVVGEYVNPNNNDDISGDFDFKRFLSLVFTKDVSHVLLGIRNKLSHLQSHELKLKFECEKNVPLFRSIQKEIKSMYHLFNLVYNFYECKESLKLLKFTEQEMTQVRELKHSSGISDQVESTFKEIDIGSMRCHTFSFYKDSYIHLFEIVLDGVEEQIAREIQWTEDWDETKNRILHVLWPLRRLVEVLIENDCIKLSHVSGTLETEENDILNDLKSITDIFSIIEKNDVLNDLKSFTDICITICKDLPQKLQNVNLPPKLQNVNLLRREKDSTADIKNTECFLKVLKGFTFLSNQQKDDIRKEIPENIKIGTEKAQKLIKSVHEGFSLNLEDKNAPELQISYLSKTKRNNIFSLYESRNRDEILSELERTNPIAQLDEILSKNSVDKKKCETMCEVMQFSEKTKTLLRKLVSGQIKKIQENNLRNLLDRIELLKKLLIEEKGEIHNLWLEVKRPSSKRHVVDKIIRHYLREPALQAAVEMVLIDCMSIFGKKRGFEHYWIKSSKLYRGINLRNILCHGNPFLDRLCEMLAPDDLASELIKKMLRLIEGEDAIRAILELYKRLNEDFSVFQNVMYNDDEEVFGELKSRIKKCDDWKNFVALLPSKRAPLANET